MSRETSPGGARRILMLAPLFLPHIGGVERHVDGVARDLVRRGHTVTVLTFKHEPALPETETREGVRILRAPSRGRRSIWSWLLRHGALLRESDVVHCHDYITFYHWYLPFRFLLPSTPVFVTFHGFEAYPPPASAIRARRLVAGLANGYLCVGEYLAKWYGTPCPNVILGAVERKDEAASHGKEAGLVLLGRLENDTAPAEVFQGLRILKERSRLEFRIDVCGDGSLRPSLEAYATRHGLEATFHGFVSDPTPFLSAARFTVASGYLSMLEAMACGSTVLAYAANPLRRDYWTISALRGQAPVVAESPEGFARCVGDLLEDPARAAGIAAIGREFAATQTWRALGDRYLQLYGVPA